MKYWVKKTVLIFTLIIVSLSTNAQALRKISGKVFTKENTKNKKDYLEGAIVAAPTSIYGTQTDHEGNFILELPDSIPTIFISYTGCNTDTVTLKSGDNTLNIELVRNTELNKFVVVEKIKSTEIGLHSIIKTETIGKGELLKAACCNLGSSFETTPSVDVSFTDAVTGYKQIRLLGLASPYTLITQENIPLIRGLATITGLTYTPGSWIDGIQLSKGSGSVVNGYESVAGQINVELKKPFSGEPFYLNLYQSSQGNTEADINLKHNFSNRLGTTFFADINSQWMKTDLNNDHFIDQPLGNQYNLLNRWIYNSPSGWMIQAGIHFLYTKGVGGSWYYVAGDKQELGMPWGYQYNTTRIEDWAKIAKVFSSRDETSIGLQLSSVNHNQVADFGTRNYTGLQNSFYANLIFQTYLFNTNNSIKAGSSLVYDDFKEQFSYLMFNRTEIVPGAFAEYSYNYAEKINIEAGVRNDYNSIYGNFITPRLHVRYAPFKRTVLRASIGRSERTANILAENLGFMAGNRQFNILNPIPGKAYGLNPEIAWNSGVNLTHKFKNGYHSGVLSIDYYYTQFQNQVVVDIDYPGYVNFYNLNGMSYAHSFSVQLDYEIVHNLNLRLAHRYYNVMCTYNGILEEKPLVPANRAFLNIDYETHNKWRFDYTVQWISSQRTPGIIHNHTGVTQGSPNYSPSYIQMNAQISKVFSPKFEIYLGGDNLTNYMQHDAIIDYANPFSRTFDASMIWGPMMGINIYAGMRYKIL